VSQLGGYVASAVLAASGIAGVVIPERVGRVLHTELSAPRARAEMRVAYACFAALGIDAMIAGTPAVFFAVGILWLGAAAVRLAALVIDRPSAEWTYWAFFVLELILGAVGFGAG
jgi:Domain of unknown function (DUF4345)